MPTAENTPLNILVVDDNADTLGMLRDALALAGMTAQTARNGQEALDAVEPSLPDLVLMDAMMPGLDGFETCQIIKQDRGYADLPIIFMTGYDESEHMAKAFASGGVDYIAKPIQFQEMFARIKVHLSNARRARSARDALDRTGRRMIACREDGSIVWTTPQAADLMQRNGLRAGDGDSLPGDVRFWLTTVGDSAGAEQQPTISVTRGDSQEGVAFRLLDQEETGEFLLHLVDLGQGTDEVRLSRTLGLSLREAEVLVWIAHGKSNKEIAELLELSPRTVNKHLEQIFNKLGVENRTAAATRATRVLMDWR